MVIFIQTKKKSLIRSSSIKTLFSLSFLLLSSFYSSAQQVTEIITDFGGYWRTNTTTNNTTKPDSSHNLLAFTVGGTLYSTGANNTILTNKGVSFTTGNFKCLPITSVTGTISSLACAIGLAVKNDGVPNGYSSPLPTVKMKDVLTDGINGLDLGTGVIDFPSSAKLTFPVQSIDGNSITDAKPDILFTQVALPDTTGKTDTMYFVNSANVVVGNKIIVTWGSVQSLGNYFVDFYDLQRNVACDQAVITAGLAPNNTRPLRLTAFKLSDFGITGTNKALVASLVLQPCGKSDVGFVAYNTDAFVIAPPTITSQPQTQIVCTGAVSSATFSVVATGTSDTYQWQKDGISIPGATSASYTISPVTAASAAGYNVVITNAGGTVTSNTAYLNTEITKQPSSQTVVTGNTVALSVSASNTTAFQWQKNGVAIPGATDSIYTISPLNRSDSGSYTVKAINNASSGCATVTSSPAVITPVIIVYSKSTPNINIPSTWGANTDGSGSTPVDFTRSEHTFVLSNRPWGNTLTDLTIAGTLDVSNGIAIIADSTTLDVGWCIRSGTGSLSGSVTSGFTVRGNSNLYFTPNYQLLKNFTIKGGTVNMLSDLIISGGTLPGKLNLTGGTLAVGNNKITLRSTSTTNTSMVTAVGSTASISYGSRGAFVVERFVPGKRSYRFVSPAVTTTTSIKSNWMEGVVNPDRWNNYNPLPGYGTHITGPRTAADSLDVTQTYNPSLFTFDNNGQAWNPVLNSAGTLTAGSPFRLMVRGSRAVDLNNNDAAPSNTIIRATGAITTGNFTLGSSTLSGRAGGYSFIGNPYACPVNWLTLAKTNITNSYYTWDESFNRHGAYVAYNGDKQTNDKPGSMVDENIQSQQAFFVQSTSVTPSITFTESNKSSNNTSVFRTTNTMTKLSVELLLSLDGGNSNTADGFVVVYEDNISKAGVNEDSYKFTNLDENIAINQNGSLLSIEGRPFISGTDTIVVKMWQFRQKEYWLRLTAQNFDPEINVTLQDNFLKSTTPVSLLSATTIPFTITGDSASFAPNRFSVLFSKAVTLPIAVTTVKAYQQEKGIQVEWQNTVDTNVGHYEVERSFNSQQFDRVCTKPASFDNSLNHSYDFLDVNAYKGTNFYRIKIIEKTGSVKYSEVVRVNVADSKSDITVYPNPIKGNSISLQMTNMEEGEYSVNITNITGEKIYTTTFRHVGNSSIEKLSLKKKPAAGTYTLQISNDKTAINKSILVQ